MTRFFLALRFLTVYPFGHDEEVTTEDLVGSTIYYPVVGALVGMVLFGFWMWAKSVWPVLLASSLTVILWEGISAGLHLDGLMDTFDGLGIRGDLERRLTVMKDSRVGAFGAQAGILAMFLKIAALAALAENPAFATVLILAPIIGRASMVILMGSSVYARAGGGLGKTFVDLTGKTQILIALFLLVGFGFAAVGWRIFWIVLAMTVFFLLLRQFFKHNFGGVTGDILGATCELLELGVLIVAPLFLA